MTAFVFLGPSLSRSEAEQHLAAVYLPPARQGDVARLLAKRPRAIGIIDGYFNHVPAVSHKEILEALSRGIRVYGGASMGALRAAELHPFGMVGVGKVYEWYRSGALSDDDEVAVVHGSEEDGFSEQSLAMVNLRDAAEHAVRDGLISPALAERLVSVGKRLFYPERVLRRIIRIIGESRGDSKELAGIEDLPSFRGPSLKKRDALALLDRMAADVDDASSPGETCAVERTIHLQRLLNDVELDGYETRGEPELEAGELQGIAPAEAKALLSLLAQYHFEQMGMQIDRAQSARRAEALRRSRGLQRREAMNQWLEANRLSKVQFSEAIADMTRIAQLRRLYSDQIESRVAERKVFDAALHSSAGEAKPEGTDKVT